MRIEKVVGKKFDEWPTDKEDVALLRERVDHAARIVTSELREKEKEGKGKKRNRKMEDMGDDRDDDMVEAGMPTRKHKKRK